jgi:GntR family phosphonate transport system transcriptional regulator
MSKPARPPVWTSIARDLTEDLAQARYAPGDKLPTEAQLAARFGVNRHTVRRALGEMAEQGLVHARRGAGVFVAQKPTDYALGQRVRYHENLAAQGRIPGKEVLSLERRAADRAEAKALRLESGDEVLVYDGLSLSDGQPLSVFRSVFPAARFPGLLDRLRSGGSVTEALRGEGVADYRRASTRITAETASATQALHLRLSDGALMLRTVGINVDAEGQPVEYGISWFAGDRVTLTVGDL